MSSRTTLAWGISLSLLAPVALVVGCGGDDSGPSRNNTASGGSGGSSAGGSDATGGTDASGGSSASGGTGGGSTMTPYECNAFVLSSDAPNVTDFSVTAVSDTQTLWGQALGDEDSGTVVDQTQLWGGLFQYGSVDFAVTDEAFVVSGEVSDYSGGGLWFGPCVDATAFSGISFDVSGDPGASGSITFMFQTNADSPINDTDMRGACAFDPPDEQYSDCVQPSASVPVTEEPQTVTITWAQVSGGKPSAGTDGSDLLGLQFQFAWSSTASPYNASITIDNIKFVP